MTLLSYSTRQIKRFRLPLFSVGLLAAIYTLSVLIAAMSTLNLVSDFSVQEIANPDASIQEAIDESLSRLGAVEESLARTKRVATPITKMCGVTNWIAIARDNCDAVDGLFSRFDADKKAAESLLKSVEIMDRTVGSFLDDVDQTTSFDWDESIASLREEMTKYDQSASAAALISIGDDSHALPQLKSGYHKAILVERELSQLAVFIHAGVDLLESARAVQQMGESSFAELTVSSEGSRDLKRVRTTLESLNPVVQEFRSDVFQFGELLPSYLEGSNIELQIMTISSDVDLLAKIIRGIATPVDVLGQVFDSARMEDGSLFESGAVIQILDRMAEQDAELKEAREALKSAASRLSGASGLRGILGERVAGKLEQLLNDYSGVVDVMSEAPETLGDFFGKEGPKRYLVLGQSSDEIRAAGGFTSSTWFITFNNGNIEEIEYVDVLQFGERKVLDQLPDPPTPLNVHMDTQAWYLRDVGWSPDFRSVGNSALIMSAATGRHDLDGVISMTQWAIVYFVSALGHIDTAQGRLRGDDVMSAIEVGTDTDGNRYLLGLFEAVIDSLTVSRLEENFVEFFSELLRALSEKQIMLYMKDPLHQQTFDSLQWSGALPPADGDMLGVFDSNVGWNKVGRNIDRHVQYTVALTEEGGGLVDLALTYNNRSHGSSSDCESQDQPISGENLYTLLKDGCYWNLFRVYTPAGIEVSAFPYLPIPAGSVAARTGVLDLDENTAELLWDDSGQHIQGLITVPPEESTEVKLEYELPDNTSTITTDELEYILFIPVQSGVLNSSLEIKLYVPEGYTILESSLPNNSSAPNTFYSNLTLETDMRLRILAAKSE